MDDDLKKASAPRTLSCVALLSPAWPVDLLPNGVGTYTAQLRAGLNELGVRSVIVTPRTGGAPADPDVIDFGAMPGGGRLIRFTDRVRYPGRPHLQAQQRRTRRLRAGIRHAADACGAQLIETSEWGVLGDRPAALGRLPVVVRLHGPWFLNGRVNGVPEDADFHWRLAQEGRTIAAAAGITAPSRDVLDRTRAFYDLELPHAAVIPNPIVAPPPAQQWRYEACERHRILFVGRFDRHKGGDVVIDALAQLCKQMPACRLIFVGPDRGCPDESGQWWQLQQYAADRLGPELAARHLEVLGSLPPARITELRQSAMMTVVPSRYETFGFTALESMAQGMPTIASHVGGLAEIVRHEHTGLTVEPGDPAALAQAIQRVIDDPALACELGAQARADVIEHYHPAAVAARTCAYYERVLAQREGRFESAEIDGATDRESGVGRP